MNEKLAAHENYMRSLEQQMKRKVQLEKAAPDLLFACKLVMAEYGEVFSHGGNQARAIFDKLTAAIAKAEGN